MMISSGHPATITMNKYHSLGRASVCRRQIIITTGAPHRAIANKMAETTQKRKMSNVLVNITA